MEKIYYNKDGWICQRYPYNLPIENENLFIEVNQKDYAKTFVIAYGKNWRVVNGKLVEVIYDTEKYKLLETQKEIYQLKDEIAKIKEDVEQVELFGMERSDYTQKKARCVEIIQRLRVLEARLEELKEGE